MERVLLFTIDEDTSEIESLLDTLGVTVIEEFIQNRAHPHKVGFLGPGRLDEIEKDVENLDFDSIVVNGHLKPSQHHYIEMRFQTECIDRTGIILRIFADHAHTPEAIAQVTLARLRYELPFLREWIHKAKSGDRPGFLAGGAYATDIYFEHAKTQARRIEQNLEELSRQREVTRTKRHAKGYTLVSLAGYTNAGKSALFNRLCNAGVEVDSRLFSTLSTTTRKVVKIPGNVLMVDTVGFIKDLPPDLVDAFNSTLEEIFFADLILLVFDASDPISLIRTKLQTCMEILLPKIQNQRLIVLANKSDLLTSGEKEKILSEIHQLVNTHPSFAVSARTGEGLDKIRELIAEMQIRNTVIEAILPITDSSMSLLSRLRGTCHVVETFTSNRVEISIRCKEEDVQKIVGWLRKLRATNLQVVQELPSIEGEQLQKDSIGSKGAPLE